MNHYTIVLDIETIGTTRQDVIDYIAASIKPPGTIKLPASIEKWQKENKAEAVEDAVSKTGLDGAFGQVVCIGLILPSAIDPITIYGLDERDLLIGLNMALDIIPNNIWSATTIVGHNVLGFDLRFLMQRYIVNSIVPHPIIATAVTAKAWDNRVYDTMTQFAGFGKTISLDKLCMALGITSPKGDMDGSMVSQAVADGRIAEVSEYCKRDLVATLTVYKRMTFQ